MPTQIELSKEEKLQKLKLNQIIGINVKTLIKFEDM